MTQTTTDLDTRIAEVLEGLNVAQTAYEIRMGWTHRAQVEQWHAVPKRKYINIDYGTSGAFLVDRETGELFNIQGYGTPDRNKKRKADIGNIFTCDPAVLFTKRYNYLR